MCLRVRLDTAEISGVPPNHCLGIRKWRKFGCATREKKTEEEEDTRQRATLSSREGYEDRNRSYS